MSVGGNAGGAGPVDEGEDPSGGSTETGADVGTYGAGGGK